MMVKGKRRDEGPSSFISHGVDRAGRIGIIVITTSDLGLSLVTAESVKQDVRTLGPSGRGQRSHI